MMMSQFTTYIMYCNTTSWFRTMEVLINRYEIFINIILDIINVKRKKKRKESRATPL